MSGYCSTYPSEAVWWMVAFHTVDVYLELADEEVGSQTAKTWDWSVWLLVSLPVKFPDQSKVFDSSRT